MPLPATRQQCHDEATFGPSLFAMWALEGGCIISEPAWNRTGIAPASHAMRSVLRFVQITHLVSGKLPQTLSKSLL